MRIEDFLGNQRHEFELRVIIQALKKDGWNAISWGYDDLDEFDIRDVDLRKRPHGQMTYDTGFAQIIDYEEFGIKFEDKNGKTAWIACMLGNGWGELCYDFSTRLLSEDIGVANRNPHFNTYYDMNLQEILELFDVTNTFRIVSLLPKQSRQEEALKNELVKAERKELRKQLKEKYPNESSFKLGKCPTCGNPHIRLYTVNDCHAHLGEPSEHEVWWECSHYRVHKGE